jgi:hypothetical protein
MNWSAMRRFLRKFFSKILAAVWANPQGAAMRGNPVDPFERTKS